MEWATCCGITFHPCQNHLFWTEFSSLTEVTQLLTEVPSLKSWQRPRNDDSFPNNPRLENAFNEQKRVWLMFLTWNYTTSVFAPGQRFDYWKVREKPCIGIDLCGKFNEIHNGSRGRTPLHDFSGSQRRVSVWTATRQGKASNFMFRTYALCNQNIWIV